MDSEGTNWLGHGEGRLGMQESLRGGHPVTNPESTVTGCGVGCHAKTVADPSVPIPPVLAVCPGPQVGVDPSPTSLGVGLGHVESYGNWDLEEHGSKDLLKRDDDMPNLMELHYLMVEVLVGTVANMEASEMLFAKMQSMGRRISADIKVA